MTKSNTPDPQQHETSSLFSLSSLQEMSGPAPAPAPSKPPSASEEEGSGMLDILAIAGSAKQANPVGRIAPRPTPTPALLTSPVAQAAEEGLSSRTKLIMAGMGVAILLLGGATAFLALRPAATASVRGPVAGAASVVPPGPAVTAPVAALAPQPTEEVAPTPAEPAAAEPTKVAKVEPRARTKAEAREEAVEAAPAVEKSADKSIDNLLDQALGGGGVVAPKKAKSEAKPAAGAASPSRDDVLAAMTSVTPKVKACSKGEGGVAMAKITMAGATGRVTGVDVGGITDTGVKTCITREVSKAKVPAFSNPTFSVTYPFKL